MSENSDDEWIDNLIQMSTSFCSVDSSSKEEPMDYRESRSDSIGIPQIFRNGMKEYRKPPKKHGLHNARRILQSSYIDRMMRGKPIDYFEILKDDIRNIRPFTKDQLKYVKNLKPEEMFEIIEIFNKITISLIKIADLPQDELETDEEM